jgi:hypothetical protein
MWTALPVKACTALALDVAGAEVVTIEGLAAPDGTLSPVQEAFREHHGLQCGFCTPGMIMSATALLPRPEADRGGGARISRGQYLPLHGIPQHRQGDPRGQRAGRVGDRGRIDGGARWRATARGVFLER